MGLKSFIKKFSKSEKSNTSGETQANSEWDSLAEMAQSAETQQAPEIDTSSPSYQRRLREKGIDSKGNYIFADAETAQKGFADIESNFVGTGKDSYWRDQIVFVSEGDFRELQDSPLVEAGIKSDRKMNEETAIRAISNEYFFQKAQDIISGKIDIFQQWVCLEAPDSSGGTYLDVVSITHSEIGSPAQLVRTLDQLQADGKLPDLNDTESQRLAELREATSVDAFHEYCSQNELHETMDGKDFVFDGNEVFDYFDCTDEEFLDKLNQGASVSGASMPELAKFLDDHSKLFDDKFCLPQNVREHMSDFRRVIDHKYINQLLETNEPMLEKAKLSPELHDAIVEGLPEDGTNLEKALYTYIKICKLLSYDDRFLAGKDGEELKDQHNSIDYLETITPENNRAVCWELNMILGKMLSEYGVNFETSYYDITGQKQKDGSYGTHHANLRFRCDDIIVGADMVKQVYKSDLIAAKTNAPLGGLRIMSSDYGARKRFDDAYEKMYALIQEQESESGKDPEAEKQHRIDESLREYAESQGGYEQISLQEKQDILLNIVKNNRLRGTDVSVRLYQLFDAMFDKEYKQDRANISVVRRDIYREDAEDDALEDIAVETVLSFNDEGFDNSPEKTKHYYVTNKSELYEVGTDELQEVFNTEQLTIVTGMPLKPVPNIKLEGLSSLRTNE